MSRVSINKLFFETCLAHYKDDISNSIYFVGPMGTMFTALKSLFTIINLSTGKSALKIYEDADKTKYKDLDWTSMFDFVKQINNIG